MPINLSSVRLVNWHIFSDVNIRIGETTLFAGDNGSGKSTIIDAIQYGLVADLKHIKFNSAASDRKTGRTLDSYCRGKIGAEGLDFIRPGDCISHVMLEFAGDSGSFCAGIMIETYADGSTPNESLWLCQEIQSADIIIVEKGKPVSPRSFRDYIASRKGSVYKSKREYIKDLTMKLGVFRRNAEFNPYLEAFVRAVSFTPLNSVDQFVCNYILDDKPLDVSNMKQNLENYRTAEREAQGVQRRIEKLDAMEEKADEIKKADRQILQKQYLKLRIEHEIAADDVDRNKKAYSIVQREHEAIVSEINSGGEEESRTRDLIQQSNIALAKNDAHLLFTSLTKEMEDCGRAVYLQKERLDRKKMLSTQCQALLGRTLEENIDNEIIRVESDKNAVVEKKNDDKRKINEYETQLSAYQKEHEELKKGLLKYPESVDSIRIALSGAGVSNYVFSDLLEVTDVGWQNAVEGWLNTQRFSILVQETDFQKAIEVYRSLPRSISGIGIPNLAKMRGAKPDIKSLFSVVKTDSPLAEIYAVYILGDVIMADIDALKNYSKSVTPDCMRYSSHTASRIKEDVYARWYIGKKAKERRMQFLEEEMTRLKEEILGLNEEIHKAESAIEALQNAVHSLIEIRSLADAQTLYNARADELKSLTERRCAVDTSSFENLEREIAALKLHADDLRRKQNARIEQKGKLEGRKTSLESQKESFEGKFEETRTMLESFAGTLSGIEEFRAYYEERIRESDKEALLKNYEPSLRSSQTRRETLSRALSELVIRYNADFNESISDRAEETQEIPLLLKKYTDTELPLYLEKILRAKKDAEKQFLGDFVARLAENMQNAKESIREINQTLKSISFGRDRYRFHVEDRPEKRAEISVIQKAAEISRNVDTLFDSLTTDDERKTVKNLFDTILNKELTSPEVMAICDYRRYYQYDIKMIDTTLTDETSGKERELSLSRVIREKSGGEAQTPYYVAIAASFLRFFRNGESTIRLALFDEAFNKMDDSRIENTIGFFKTIGIQVVTAVPTEKIETIAPFMDTTNLVIRHGLSADVRVYRIMKQENPE